MDAGVQIVVEIIDVIYVRQQLVANSAVFVCLLDLRWMSCLDCGTPSRALQFSFAGHFVVLHGYDAAVDTFLYMDPAAPCGEIACLTAILTLSTVLLMFSTPSS